jgi:hypothetical protein
MVDIRGIDKALVLQALWDGAKEFGRGKVKHPSCTEIEARGVTSKASNVGHAYRYVRGRSIQCDLSGDTLDPTRYDSENGKDAAQRAIDKIKAKTLGRV